VVGIDAAPTMVELALRQASAAGITNATFMLADGLDSLTDESFDLIVSLIVFQHIPIPEGMAIAARLLRKLKPGGVAALHFSTQRPGGRVAIREAVELILKAQDRWAVVIQQFYA